MKFRVLRGIHSEKDGNNVPRVYKKGDVVDSKKDLSTLNAPGMQPKFEHVEDAAPSKGTAMPALSPPPINVSTSVAPKTQAEYFAALDKMTVKELQDHAAEEEVDVRSAGNDKNKLLAILKKV